MPRSRRHSLLAVLCVLPIAACGGGESAKPAATPAPTAAGGGTSALLACLAESDPALELAPRAESDTLQMTGVDASTYETVAIDQDGSLGMQVLVFASEGAAATGAEQVEANGFFDDVRPAGNTLVIRRGGDAPGTIRVVECGFAA